VTLPLIGGYQAANALVAAALVIATGGEPGATLGHLARIAGVRGRLERAVITPSGAPVYVDYAHTPDALEAAVAALRPHTANRLILLFGCGGDRDRGKRPEMGAIAVRDADVVIVTDDNPRSENPAAIRAEIMAAAQGAREVGGRADAIRAALAEAKAGDVVLLAGKGHEQGQIVGNDVLPFDDADVARAAAAELAPMMAPLWTGEAIAAATGGVLSAPFEARGVTFDSREVIGGELFVAMRGAASDGHAFVDSAAVRGAAGFIVEKPVAFPHVLVADSLRALEALGVAARARAKATIIGVTGSVGKTGTKEALRMALERIAPDATHWSVKSYNNHTGVPLSLSRMPADTRFGVFEMGMNHAGEIAGLTAMVRPMWPSSPGSPMRTSRISTTRTASPGPRRKSSRVSSRAAWPSGRTTTAMPISWRPPLPHADCVR
jgi:MurE/MurF fusion protein